MAQSYYDFCEAWDVVPFDEDEDAARLEAARRRRLWEEDEATILAEQAHAQRSRRGSDAWGWPDEE